MSKETYDWFSSEYYQLLYSSRNEAEAKYFLNNLIPILRLPAKSKIIDCGCGRGRHSVELAQRGFKVTGIDISETNIAFAKKNKIKNLSFAVHDLRKPFPQAGYDLALSLFTSFGYYERSANENVFKNISSSLRKGGILVFDFMNPTREIKKLVPEETIMRGEIRFSLLKEIQGNHIVKKIHVKEGKQQFHFVERVFLFTENELSELFTRNGMRIQHRFGSYALESFRKEISPRLILIAEKSGIEK